MTEQTHALRRDDQGFLTYRSANRPDRSPVLWMSIAMVGCWIGACALSLAISFSWIV
jgi:hypothetical protein